MPRPRSWFAIAAVLAPACAAAGEIGLEYLYDSNGPVISPNAWAGRPLEKAPRPVIAMVDARISGEQAVGGIPWVASHGVKAYFSGDSNALAVVAAVDRAGQIVYPDPAVLAMHGRLQLLHSTDIGIRTSLPLASGLSVDLHPYVSIVHHYQRVQVDGTLVAEAGSARLDGAMSRVSTGTLGYLENDRQYRGIGAGLDLRVAVERGGWRASLQLDNLVHQLWFADLHYSRTRYQVNTFRGSPIERDIGEYSVSGTYGVSPGRESLPVRGRLQLSIDRAPSWSGGLVSLGSQVQAWCAYEGRWGPFTYGLRSVALRNLSIDLGWISQRGVRATVGVALAPGARPVLGRLSVGYAW